MNVRLVRWAIVFAVVVSGCSSDSDNAPSTSGASTLCKAVGTNNGEVVVPAGCKCGPDVATSPKPFFPSKCTAANVGKKAACCKSGTGCRCIAIRCGLSLVASECICGHEPVISSDLQECTSYGSICCRSKISNLCSCGSAECSSGIEYPIDGCTPDWVDEPACDSGETTVDSCE